MKIVREPARVIASVFSLCGFLVAVLAGMKAGASSTHILLSAIGALLVCKAIGLWAGWAGERAIREFIEAYQKANPVPDIREAGRTILNQPSGGNVDSSVNKRAA